MSETNFLADYLDLEPFAKEVDRNPRTVRRWLNEPDGLPYTRIGNRILIALLVFVIGFGLYMLVHATGLLPSIPDRYVLWSLIAIALAIPGVIWVRYIVLVVREQGRPTHQ